MNKAIFLDRDGVINKDLSYVYKKEDLFLLDNVIEGLKELKAQGYFLIVISNQSGVARGFFKEEDVRSFHEEIQHRLIENNCSVDAFYYCPHYVKGVVEKYSIECNCRKPKTGLVEKAQKDFDLDLGECVVVGDKVSDMELAKNIGCMGIQIQGNYPLSTDYPVKKDLLEVSEYVKEITTFRIKS